MSCLEQCVLKWDLHGASGQSLHSQLSQTYQNFYVLHNDATKGSYTTICIMVLFCGELQTSSSFTSKLFLVLLLSFLETFFSCVCECQRCRVGDPCVWRHACAHKDDVFMIQHRHISALFCQLLARCLHINNFAGKL